MGKKNVRGSRARLDSLSKCCSAGVNYRVSQNFLTSRKIITGILNLTSITKHDHVIEIGPGKGHITRELLNKCGRVTAVEIDPKLYAHLAEGPVGLDKRLTLINRDFLKVNLPLGPYKVFSNIPFSITTDIVTKLTNAGNTPSEAWLVMEKGAALRFMGLPHENARSLMIKPFFDIGIVYRFNRAKYCIFNGFAFSDVGCKE